MPTGTWLAWSPVKSIAARVAQEWTPAGTALNDGPSDGAQRLTNGDWLPIPDRHSEDLFAGVRVEGF